MAGSSQDHPASTHPLLAVLRSPALARALLAFFFFNMAEWATYIAILVWAFETGGASAAGLIAVVQLVPAMLAAPFTSVLGDRMRRDRALSIGYGVQAVAFLAAAAALMADAPDFLVYITAAVAATAITFTRPVHNAIVPEVAETPGQLTAGNSASSTVEGIGIFAGPLLTGVILAFTGPEWVYALFGITGVVSALLTWSLPLKRTFNRAADPERVLKATVEGLRTLRRQTGALLLLLVVGAQFVVLGLLDILTVVYGIDVLDMGPSGPGILTAALGVGSLVGAAVTVVLVGRRRLAPALAVGLLGTGIPLIAVALTTLPLVAWLFLALSGVGKAFVDVSGRTLLQRSVDSGTLSRIFGVQESLLMGGSALGTAVAPLLVTYLGARGAFVATGVVLPVVGLLAWTQIRKLDSTALQPGPGFTLLESIPMFAVLPAAVLEKLSRDLEQLSVPDATDIVTQGEVGDRLYLVAQGQVDILKNGVSVDTTGAGDFFGEIALLRNVRRTATVRAIGDVELYALGRDDFLEAVTGSSAAQELADTVADRRIQNTDET